MKHRAQTLSGEWVVGWYVYDGRKHTITTWLKRPLDLYPTVFVQEIIPKTLSIETFKLDSKGEMIFGSFELDGVMTQGGDVLEDYGEYPFPVVFSKSHCAFIMLSENEYWAMLGDYREDAITIIGKQSEVVK